MRIGCVLLAAGIGKRFGSNKLLEDIAGKPLIDYILAALPSEAFSDCVAVASNEDVQAHVLDAGYRTVFNDKPLEGISLSIRLGVQSIAQVDACMFVVADQPLLKKSTITSMIESYVPGYILSLAHNGRRGNPVIFPASLLVELASLSFGEFGTKVIYANESLLVLHETADASELKDIDTLEDLAHIKAYLMQTNQ